MTVPAIVEGRLQNDAVTARVPLGGDDELFVTPSSSLVYRAEGLLSGESVEEYSHEAERVELKEGRRKCTITLDHGLDGESQITVPAGRLEEALEPILRGVFETAGITEPHESVEEVYRLGELTIVVTDARVIKHVGNALWDEEFEEYPFEDVTGIDVEEGSVSSQIIVEVEGRPQRVKTPSDDARRIRSRIEDGVLAHPGYSSYDEFRRAVSADLESEALADPPAATTEAETESTEADEPVREAPEFGGDDGDAETEDADPSTGEEERTSDGMVFGAGVGTEPVERSEGEGGELEDELAALRTAVERQNDLLRRHQQVIERLVRELREQSE